MSDVISSKIMPAFQVEKLSGKFFQPITTIEQDIVMVGHQGDKKKITNKLVHSVKEFTEAYMIYFPQGHSMLVPADDTEQLLRLGVLEAPKRVDMETGEEVPEDFELTPKEIVARKTRGRVRPSHGGLGNIEATME